MRSALTAWSIPRDSSFCISSAFGYYALSSHRQRTSCHTHVGVPSEIEVYAPLRPAVDGLHARGRNDVPRGNPVLDGARSSRDEEAGASALAEE